MIEYTEEDLSEAIRKLNKYWPLLFASGYENYCGAVGQLLAEELGEA